jgi:hypothetical protein
MAQLTEGGIPQMIRNKERLYEGNLINYFQVIFNCAQNLQGKYHNFRHMFHVAWLCYLACQYYADTLSKRAMRNLLIAALFHDYNHTGMFGDDDLNIERAIRALRQHILPEDALFLDDIIELVRATQYPYVVPASRLTLCGEILRDADMSQVFSVAWIQQVIFGLAAEWGKKPIDVLGMQEPFLRSLTFHTEWAKQQFPQSDINAKIDETRELFELLTVKAD